MATVDPLEEQIHASVTQLTQRAIQLYRMRAALWAVGLALLATLAFVGLDFALHVEERGWRWLLSILWIVTLGGIAWRWLPDAASFQLTPVQVAQWIERRRPELGDSLSRLLAIRDLPEADDRYGSADFRRAAAHSCDSALTNLPVQSFLDKQPTIGAGLFCAISFMAAIGMVVISSSIAMQGLSRIALPWSYAPWPKSEQLRLVNAPGMIARDSELEVRVFDQQPPLPSLVELEVRMDERQPGTTSNMRVPMRVVDDIAVVTLPAMESDFSIRPIGGDQLDGPWHAIRVTRQPQLKEYAFTVQPPAYANQPPSELVGQRIDVLSGSRVSLHGKFDERLKSLVAKPLTESKSVESATLKAGVPGHAWYAQLSADGYSFELFSSGGELWTVDEDRRWQFELETADGLRLVDPKQWMIHATNDRSPAITMAPIEPRGITRSATLNIVGTASDDLGLVDIELTWHVANQAPQSVRLWPTATDSAKKEAAAVDQRSVDVSTDWSVAMASLSVGQTLTVELVARDTAGQIGKSVTQTLEVLDEAAALSDLQRQQAESFAPLRQLLEAQRRNQQSLNRTLEVVKQLDKTGRDEIEAVTSAHQLGQSIVGGLTRNQDSVTHRLQQLGDQLQRNELSESPLSNDVARLRTQIEDLVKQRLDPALNELESTQQALRGSDNNSTRDAALNKLSDAVQSHQQATDELAALVDSVATAESLAEIQKQIQELASDQTAVASGTERMQVDTVVRGSSAQLDAQRAGIQSDQQNLARRVEELAMRLQQDAAPEKESDNKDSDRRAATDPASRKLIENAHRKLLERRISDQMRQAVEMIKSNHLSDALSAQRNAQQQLEEVAAELGGRSTGGLASSSKSMQDLAEQLEGLAGRQQRTAEKLKQAATAPNSAQLKRELANQQQALRDDIHDLADEPALQSHQNLHDLLEQATQSVDQAIQKNEQSKFEEASQDASLAAEALKSAAQAAQRKADQLQSQVAEQKMFDLRTLLSAAVKRQQPVVTSLEQINGSPAPTENANAIIELLATERQLQQQLADGRQRLDSLDAFHWLLGQCDEELLCAIAALERQRTGPETLASAKAALDMMLAAETAVGVGRRPDSQPSDSGTAPNQSSPDQRQAKQLPTLASLRLLRQMQTLINQQSEQLLNQPADSSTAALARMADRQQALAEQVAHLLEQLKQQQ